MRIAMRIAIKITHEIIEMTKVNFDPIFILTDKSPLGSSPGVVFIVGFDRLVSSSAYPFL